MKKQFKVGDIVMVRKGSIIDEDVLGYVYDVYSDLWSSGRNGVMIVTENKQDLAGFSFAEQQEFLIFVCESPFIYHHWNHKFHLNDEIQNGTFTRVIECLNNKRGGFIAPKYIKKWSIRDEEKEPINKIFK